MTLEKKMETTPEFSFGNQSVALEYDTVLVPILFEPWASQLVEDFGPWQGLTVLDLATGTGVLAKELGKEVGHTGKVIGVDINGEMLRLAKQKCADVPSAVEMIQSPADQLEFPPGSVDVVVCQQGFQFFPDQFAVAREIMKVLRIGGKVVISTWCPVSECELFGAICSALESIGEAALSNKMRVPFDFHAGG